LFSILPISDDNFIEAESSGEEFPCGFTVGNPLAFNILAEYENSVTLFFQK
jgi:hypothetical protein